MTHPNSVYKKILTYKNIPLQNLAPVLGVQVKEMGRRFHASCPFHADGDSPSLAIFPGQDKFYCFGCKTNGDKAFFISKILNVDVKIIRSIWLTGDCSKIDALSLNLDSTEINMYDVARLLVNKKLHQMLKGPSKPDDNFMQAIDAWFLRHPIIDTEIFNKILEDIQ